MANRTIHYCGGAAAGLLIAGTLPQDEGDAEAIWEQIGVVFGGVVGSRGPDIVEPPSSPNHRGTAHSAFVLALVIVATIVFGDKAREWLHGKARHFRALADQSKDATERNVFLTMAALARLAAGFLYGLGTGYVSHLALDATTAKGLPLI